MKNARSRIEQVRESAARVARTPDGHHPAAEDRHSRTLNLDVDHIRCLIGGWQEDFQAAGNLVHPIAFNMAATHLAEVHNVIMQQFLDVDDEIGLFRDITQKVVAGFREVVLMDTQEVLVVRRDPCIAD